MDLSAESVILWYLLLFHDPSSFSSNSQNIIVIHDKHEYTERIYTAIAFFLWNKTIASFYFNNNNKNMTCNFINMTKLFY